MKDLKLTPRVYALTLGLLDNYADDYMPPVDYLKLNEELIMHQVEVEEYESIVGLFLPLIRHKQFLMDVTNYFYCLGKRKDYSDRSQLIILCHLLISELKLSNKNDIIEILRSEHLKKIVYLLKLFNRSFIKEKLLEAGCQYFEEEYVNREIVSKVKENKGLLQEILIHFEHEQVAKNEECRLKTTVPCSPSLSVNLRPPPQPPNTPQTQSLALFKKPPISTYIEPKISETLEHIKLENRKASDQLLEMARGLSEFRAKQHCCPKDSPNPIPKTKIVVRENVYVKKNAATILREAARVIKDEEKEINRVNELVRGGIDFSKYEEYLEHIRMSDEQAKLQDIECKHLRGLLTREEAILARQSLLEANRAKKAQFDMEKKETEDALKKIREKHNDKVKEIINKTQQVQKNIAEQKRNMIYKKQKTAQEVMDTNRQMYEEAMNRQKEELEKKIEIIKEIKALLSIKIQLNTNRFDPTETMHFGFLCEMSLAELQERLLINRVRVKEEIENRQKCLRKQRLIQQQFLADTEEFINAIRRQKKMATTMESNKTKTNKKSKDSKDVIELREKLQKARQKRMEIKKTY